MRSRARPARWASLTSETSHTPDPSGRSARARLRGPRRLRAQPPGGGPLGALTAEETFRRVCAERPNANARFAAYDALKPVPADVRRTVRVANNQVAKTCATPPADIAAAAVTVTRAIAKICRAIGKD